MKLPQLSQTSLLEEGSKLPFFSSKLYLADAVVLRQSETDEVLSFLNVRPIHTVVMASFILDNGIESGLNRGSYYGYRDVDGKLQGVALIGHTTLVEAHTEDALLALAIAAQKSAVPIKLMMSDDRSVESFWQSFSEGKITPRLRCNELLFESQQTNATKSKLFDLRKAQPSEMWPIAEAHAKLAFDESGIDPLESDPQGFSSRVLRRIEQGRVYVVFNDAKLLFKADVVAETGVVTYLEGIYLAPDLRGRGFGSHYLAELRSVLLRSARNVCLLSNSNLKNAHRSFFKAGFQHTDSCTTIFV